ncbi:MAG TPA: hypothetical protein VNW29_02065 [Candidatus Sulfotelmatobacter sp.]|jgi:hypothetical protein|nr:hypothetical protein [Candidatus Sulfotelmatobacter sp.]
MESTQTASEYYNKTRKRSFLFSRLTVITSMFLLVIALTINILALNAHDNATAKSHAATAENQQKLLPSLPTGCMYQQVRGGFIVVCPTPTLTSTVSINVVLPKLPPQCNLETATRGNTIHCATPNTPIPTVAVTLPTTCVTTAHPKEVSCKNKVNQDITVPLPSLPIGCGYTLEANNYYVVCKSN